MRGVGTPIASQLTTIRPPCSTVPVGGGGTVTVGAATSEKGFQSVPLSITAFICTHLIYPVILLRIILYMKINGDFAPFKKLF